MKKKFKIGVALGGGGICGLAHIGFLQVLEENGIKPDIISGISMGAIIGGYYASGWNLKELEDFALKLTKNQIIELNYFKMLKQGVFSGKKIENILNKSLLVKNFEDCKIKFYAGATDLKTGKLHYFGKGNLTTALRASSAIPGIFPPVIANNTAYVDGGTSENVPFNILKKKGATVIIAVDCLNDYKKERLPKNTIQTLLYSMEVLQHNEIVTNQKMHSENFDIYCRDKTEGISHLDTDFKLIPVLIEGGRQCAKDNLNKIKKIIEKKEKLCKNTCNLEK